LTYKFSRIRVLTSKLGRGAFARYLTRETSITGYPAEEAMAFVKLLPPEDGNALPVGDVIRRLRDEFEVVDVDADAGRDHLRGHLGLYLAAASVGVRSELAHRLPTLHPVEPGSSTPAGPPTRPCRCASRA